MMLYNPQTIRKMYDKYGLSTYQIADILGAKQDTIKHNLMSSGGVREALGRSVEREVASYFRKRNNEVVEQKGDRAFDLLIEGTRVDVKSAHKGKDGRYSFALIHKESPNKVPKKHVDEYYFIPLDEVGRPIYVSSVKQFEHLRRGVSVRSFTQGKYKFDLIGYLDK